MKKGILLAVYVVVAAALIGVGAWYANRLTQSSSQISTQQTSVQTQNNQNNNMEGLIIKDITVGTGTIAAIGDNVTVNYTGTLDNGIVFDSSLKPGRTPFSFILGAGQVIKGWDEGVLGMKVGGTRELTIPPALGYGANGAGSVIPPNATLHFTITLLAVSSSSAPAGQ